MNINDKTDWPPVWDIGQWTLFFEHQELPVIPDSKIMLARLQAEKGDKLAVIDLLKIVLQDPFLCLRLLREVESKKSHRLDHETTTALAAILQLGIEGFCKLLNSCNEIPTDNPGRQKVVERARIASYLAQVWSKGRMDINPEEVALASLLGGVGDLLLWVYAPQIPQRADEHLRSGKASRSAQAQIQTCGFTFKDLTLACVERWQLPTLLQQLLSGSDSVRASVTRVCSNTARHVLDESETSILALADDIVEAARLISNVSLKWLVDAMIMIPEKKRTDVLDRARTQLETSRSE